MKTITISNEKGGVGKTTTCHHFAVGLSKKGYKVIVIDFDRQRNLSRTINAPETGIKTIYDILEGEPIENCIYKSNQGIHYISGSEKLLNADKRFSDTDSPYLLQEPLQRISKYYDFCLIDTPPHMGILNTISMTASNEILIPLQASTYSIEGLSGIIESFQKVKRYTNPQLIISGLLLTMYEGRTIFRRTMTKKIEDISEQTGLPVFKTTIRKGIVIDEVQQKRTNVFDYNPKSNIGIDYQNFIDEYLKKAREQSKQNQ